MAKQSDLVEPSSPDFEAALRELEGLVARMERGELTLDESLKEFERGIQLTRLCQDKLKVAEQRVRLLSADGSEADFSSSNEASEWN